MSMESFSGTLDALPEENGSFPTFMMYELWNLRDLTHDRAHIANSLRSLAFYYVEITLLLVSSLKVIVTIICLVSISA